MDIFFSPEVFFFKKKTETFFISRYHCFTVVFRQGASQLGSHVLDAHGLNTERARVAGGHFASHGLSPHGFSTECARLAGGTSLRSWFQKKCLLPAGIFIFSPKKWLLPVGILIFFQKKWLLPVGIFIFFPPILKLEVGFFSDKKSFSQNG